MKIKAKYWLAPVLLGALFTSCDKDDLEDVAPAIIAGTESAISKATSASIFFERLFEDSNPLSGLNVEAYQDYSMQPSSERAFQGSRGLRLELRESDPEVAGGTRTELNLNYAQNKEQWYSFAVYFPSEFNGADSHAESLTQWHSVPDSHLGESWRGPAKSVQIRNGRLVMKIGYNAQQVSSGYEGEKEYDLGPLPTNSWQQFTFHIIHSYGSDGLVQLWINGKSVLEHRGGNSYNDQNLPFWKVGLYKWGWNGANKTDVSKRVLFYDNIRQGNASATLQDMIGEAPTIQPDPTPAPSPYPASGVITREFWANVQGTQISNIPLDSQPTSVSELTKFEAPSNAAENYGARIRGFITAPATGSYTFWISGDDHSELWLSTSEDPARKVKLAYVNGYTGSREWNKYSSQKSVQVRLEAGKRYYIEALHKEAYGGDNLAVGWQLPNGSQELPIAGSRLSSYNGNTQPQPAPVTGLIKREFWANVQGTQISNIPLDLQPTSVSELTKFEAPSNVAEYFGARIRGFITAPATGSYTFWISGDDHSELWLSTSEDPARKVKLAYVNGYTGSREWNKYSSQKSVQVRLEAGKRYYIEALHKEIFGGDNLAVGWQLPNGSQELPIAGSRLSPYN